jgi:hypothetical protein
MPLRRDVAVIVSAKGTEDQGFESRQGARLLGICNAVLNSLCYCVYQESIFSAIINNFRRKKLRFSQKPML